MNFLCPAASIASLADAVKANAEDRIELKKPEQLNAGDAAEALRLEVSVQ